MGHIPVFKQICASPHQMLFQHQNISQFSVSKSRYALIVFTYFNINRV